MPRRSRPARPAAGAPAARRSGPTAPQAGQSGSQRATSAPQSSAAPGAAAAGRRQRRAASGLLPPGLPAPPLFQQLELDHRLIGPPVGLARRQQRLQLSARARPVRLRCRPGAAQAAGGSRDGWGCGAPAARRRGHGRAGSPTSRRYSSARSGWRICRPGLFQHRRVPGASAPGAARRRACARAPGTKPGSAAKASFSSAAAPRASSACSAAASASGARAFPGGASASASRQSLRRSAIRCRSSRTQAGVGDGGLRLARQPLRLRPVLARDRLAQQAAQPEEPRLRPRRQRRIGLGGAVLPPGQALGLCRQQQQLRRVAQPRARPLHLCPCGGDSAGGQRHQGAGDGLFPLGPARGPPAAPAAAPARRRARAAPQAARAAAGSRRREAPAAPADRW